MPEVYINADSAFFENFDNNILKLLSYVAESVKYDEKTNRPLLKSTGLSCSKECYNRRYTYEYIIDRVNAIIQSLPIKNSENLTMQCYVSGRQMRKLINCSKGKKGRISCYGILIYAVIYDILSEYHENDCEPNILEMAKSFSDVIMNVYNETEKVNVQELCHFWIECVEKYENSRNTKELPSIRIQNYYY